MRIIATHILLIFYTIAVLKPVMPLAYDFIAHNFAQQYHIATVHQTYGKNHVHKEVVKASEEQNDQNNTSKQKSNEPVSVHIGATNSFNISQPSSGNKYSSLDCLDLKHPLRHIDIPPPKLLISFF